MNITLEEKARLFATAAHAAIGQRRKYTGEPYINHPQEVVAILKESGNIDDTMLAAAWLHDVVEDTAIAHYDIHEHFGDGVADLVFWLTDISKPSDGNRAARKLLDRAHISSAPASAKTIKLADLISNTRSIVEHDKDFAMIYIEEKILLLDHLKEGDAYLYLKASQQVNDAMRCLKS